MTDRQDERERLHLEHEAMVAERLQRQWEQRRLEQAEARQVTFARGRSSAEELGKKDSASASAIEERLNNPTLDKPGLRENASALAIEERQNPRLGKPGLRENASALAIEERQNNTRLGKPGLIEHASAIAIEERQNNPRLGKSGLRENAGCNYLLDWTTGLDYWTGLLDWTTGLTFDLRNAVVQAMSKTAHAH